MNTLILNPFTIPTIISFVLIVFLVREVYNKYPEEKNTNGEMNHRENRRNKSDEDTYRDDFLDFSGGTFGIE